MNDDERKKFLRQSKLINKLLDFIENQEEIPEEFKKILEEEWEQGEEYRDCILRHRPLQPGDMGRKK